MKHTILASIAAALLALAGCSSEPRGDANTLSVAATAVPHAEILEAIAPQLKQQGITLEVKVFNDYVQPNLQVEQKQVDVNFFQTKPYLDEFNASRGTRLVTLAGVHVEPLGGYSRKWKTLEEVPAGANIAIPNEASNGGRALLLLQKAGLIALKEPTNPLSTLHDITENPKQLVFRELESATLPRILNEVDLALINTNYALDAKLNPVRDALLIEASDSPYINYLVGRADQQNDARIEKLIAVLHSPETKKFIEEKYSGAVIPAF